MVTDMLTRKIERTIADWIHNSKKALLIDGARQVGKTYIIRKTLEQEGCDYLEFNLLKTPELAAVLEHSETAEDLVTNLSLFADKPFVMGKTFVFIDEIQECRDLSTRIKFWVDEGSFRYIFSGSLLGVALRGSKSAPVGYLKTVTMYPLDFEEFLQLYNYTEELRGKLQQSYRERVPVNGAVHDRLMNIFNMYLNVGGMPAAVDRFRDTRNLEDVIAEHEDIILQYKRDFTKYEAEDRRIYLTKIYDLIPTELNACNKRFNYADLKKGLGFERSEEDFVWLEKAGVALPVYNVETPEIPLRLNEKHSLFKFFLSDVGMLTTMYGKSVKRALVTGDGSVNYGAIYENVAAQEMTAHGFPLYYYNSKKMGEMDFLVEQNGKVLPVEIKSGKDYQRHSALQNVMNIPEYGIEQAIVFSNYNVSVEDRVVYYPIYFLMFLRSEDIELPTVALDDLREF